uniref:Deoxyribonuclease n=1 Tax=Strigamia maritima TaxID=126957 RepID=T1JG01_STRMM
MMKLNYLLCVIILAGAVHRIQGQSVTRATAASLLTVGAFNVQNFSPKKIENEKVLALIIDILNRYDIVLVQELVDRKSKIVNFILESLNRAHGKEVFGVVASPRVGRSSQKEQYGYFYRKNKVKVLNSYLYDDQDDHYEREPFVVTFQSKRAKGLNNFTMVGIHVKPDAAVAELQTLHNVIESVAKRDSKDVILLGDLNADCSYVAKKYWPTIPLWTNDKYLWLIPHDADTTATPSNCAYDRVILRGDKIKSSVVLSSVQIFQFEKEYNLPNELVII